MSARAVVRRHAPRSARRHRARRAAEFGATAQGYLAVALGLVMAAAMGVSGVLYARSDGLAYGAMAVVAGVGGLFAWAADRRRREMQV